MRTEISEFVGYCKIMRKVYSVASIHQKWIKGLHNKFITQVGNCKVTSKLSKSKLEEGNYKKKTLEQKLMNWKHTKTPKINQWKQD